jgi:glycosyltransferase involved in cell wall biosynthesis
MKVGFFNHTGDVSGAEISLLLTAKHLKMAQPVILAPAGELLERARRLGLETAEVPGCAPRLTRNPLRLLAGLTGMLKAGMQFAKTAQLLQVDIIHANSLRAGIMASMFGWLHRCPVIWHVRDMPPSGAIGSVIRRLAALTARAVVGISESVLKGLDSGKLKDRLFLVHNGVEIREISELEKRMWKKRIREELGAPMSAKVLVIVGQITPWKRQEDAIGAARILLEKGHDVYLWIVGEAKFRKENWAYWAKLQHLAKQGVLNGRVKFTGFRNDVTEICCAADLLFLCSDQEPFGRVLIEAMSVSVPVVATDAGGVPEIVEHGVSGLLYPVGDVRALAENAEKLLTNDLFRKQAGMAAAERVREHFTIGVTVARLENVYRLVLQRPKGMSPAVRPYHQSEKKVHDAEV